MSSGNRFLWMEAGKGQMHLVLTSSTVNRFWFTESHLKDQAARPQKWWVTGSLLKRIYEEGEKQGLNKVYIASVLRRKRIAINGKDSEILKTSVKEIIQDVDLVSSEGNLLDLSK